MKPLCLLLMTPVVFTNVLKKNVDLGCPDPPVKKGFQADKYVGTWYEIAKMPVPFQINQKCVTAKYVMKDNGRIGVFNRAIDIESGEIIIAIEGEAYPPDPEVPAKLKVEFPTSNSTYNTGDYWVLDTDYNTYSVVYACTSIGGVFRRESCWILARKRTLPNETIDKLFNFLDTNGINSKKLTMTNQINCD
ncbi:apolipoprotein D-like isoform X1 [Tachypleus tridentatus]|uniref:apolipoprotein D-like isoform X1 n=1 Tax=Tachypleus tridentatus TaxID=6853 RepID=UPI003FD28682